MRTTKAEAPGVLIGAGRENRTLTLTLARSQATITSYPHIVYVRLPELMRTKSQQNRRVILGVNKPGTIINQPFPVLLESV